MGYIAAENITKYVFQPTVFSTNHRATMANVNRLVLEYPKGVSLHVALIDDSGKPIHSVEVCPPVLLRLGPNLEFQSLSSGNIRALLDLTSPEEEDDDDDDDGSDEGLDSDEAMLTDSEDTGEETTDSNRTIDLVSESESDDDDGDDNEDEDAIVVTHSMA